MLRTKVFNKITQKIGTNGGNKQKKKAFYTLKMYQKLLREKFKEWKLLLSIV